MRLWIRSHPIASFFLMAYVGTWIVWVPPVLSLEGLGILKFHLGLPAPVFLVGSTITGPTLAAFVVEWAVSGRAGVRALWQRVSQVRVNPLWYLLVLFGPVVLLLAGTSAWLGFGPIQAVSERWQLIFTSFVPALATGLVVTVFEETGWMGSAFTRLQSAFNPLVACGVLAPLWAFWHLPSFFVGGSGGAAVTGLDLPLIALQLAFLSFFALAIRINEGWIFNRSGAAVPLIMIAHSSLDQAPNLFSALKIPNMSDNGIEFSLVGALVVSALLVAAFSRGRLGFAQVSPAPVGVSKPEPSRPLAREEAGL